MNTALKKAMDLGPKNLSEGQAKSALGESLKKLGRFEKSAAKLKDNIGETGAALITTVEMQGSLFLASMGEGFFGPDKLKIGAVDVRAPVGLLSQGYGLYSILTGGKGGHHALAIGNGVTGSYLASLGQQAGMTLAQKRIDGQAQPAAPGAVPGAVPGAPPAIDASYVSQGVQPAGLPAPVPTAQVSPAVQGPIREVVPIYGDEDDDDFEPRHLQRRGRRGQRGGRRGGRGGRGGMRRGGRGRR